MTKQKVGLILFWVAVTWAVVTGVIGSILFTSTARDISMDALNQTEWALNGPLFIIWGILGVPVGAILALISMLLHSDAKGSKVWMYGVGSFLALVFSVLIGQIQYSPIILGFNGVLILFLFFGILILWSKERTVLKDSTVPGRQR